jgi:hypothetical protein
MVARCPLSMPDSLLIISRASNEAAHIARVVAAQTRPPERGVVVDFHRFARRELRQRELRAVRLLAAPHSVRRLLVPR